MWIEKSDQEFKATVKKDRRGYAFAVFVYAFIFMLIVFFFDYKIGIPLDLLPWVVHGPLSWPEYIQLLPEHLATSAGIGFVFSIYAYFRHNYQIKQVRCKKCGKSPYYTGQQTCDCGGPLIDQKKLKWVEDKETELRKSS